MAWCSRYVPGEQLLRENLRVLLQIVVDSPGQFREGEGQEHGLVKNNSRVSTDAEHAIGQRRVGSIQDRVVPGHRRLQDFRVCLTSLHGQNEYSSSQHHFCSPPVMYVREQQLSHPR